MSEEVNYKIFLLIKIFDKEEYADAFMQKGEIFCKTIGDFKKIEDDGVRGDAYECVTDWHQPQGISLDISYKDENGEDKSFSINDLAGPLIMQDNNFDRLNVYCMYAVKIPEFKEIFATEDERVQAANRINMMLKQNPTLSDEAQSLGAFAVVIYRVEDFISKLKQSAKNQGYSCWNGSVKYYDPETFHGSFKGLESAFRKRSTYSSQNEYRFAFDSDKPEGSKIIHLGDLDGIAVKIPTEKINAEIQFQLIE